MLHVPCGCRHIQEDRSLALAPGSLELDVPAPTRHVQIDSASVQALELVRPLGGPGTRSKPNAAGTLYR